MATSCSRAWPGALRGALRPTDTLARFGGDEFVAVCEGLIEPGDALPVARRLVELAAQPVEVRGEEVTVGASVGVTVVPPERIDAARAETLLREADAALYHAKAAGRRRYEVWGAHLRAAVRVPPGDDVTDGIADGTAPASHGDAAGDLAGRTRRDG